MRDHNRASLEVTRVIEERGSRKSLNLLMVGTNYGKKAFDGHPFLDSIKGKRFWRS